MWALVMCVMAGPNINPACSTVDNFSSSTVCVRAANQVRVNLINSGYYKPALSCVQKSEKRN